MNFLNINWLYIGLVALILIVIINVFSEKKRKKLLSKFASIKLLKELSQTVSNSKIRIKQMLFAIGVFAIFVALARPQYGYRWEETKTKGIDIIFAIDTSKSMLAEDVIPNRLDRAKLAVLDVLDVLGGDRIGIVAFSGQAFLQCPLTLDYDAFRMSLDALDTNVIQRGGTNIAAAINEAEIAFSKTSNKKVIVLISDGEELEASAIDKAKSAKDDNIIIYSLGVGGTRGQAITYTDEYGNKTQLKDENGKIVTSKLNEEVLTKIAQITGGFYEPLTANGMNIIYEEGLKSLPEQELSARMKQLAIERFQIPLAIAILLIALESLIGTRKFFANARRNSIIALLILTSTIMSTSQNRIYAKEKKIDVRELFNTGLDEFTKGQYQQSEKTFEEVMRQSPDNFDIHAKAFYNIANANYITAKHSLATAVTAKDLNQKISLVTQGGNSIMSMGDNLLHQGKPLLEQEQKALAEAKTDEEKEKVMQNSPLKNQQFQQQLKQTISQCDAIEKEAENLKKETNENTSKWTNANKTLEKSINNFQNALNLDKSLTDAKDNLKSAKIAKTNIDKQLTENKNLEEITKSENFKKAIEEISKLKVELQKLVRDDNQDNQDNKDNQQDNKDNKDNQNNQNNQQNQQNNSDNKDSKDNQQNQDKQNQNQDNQQDKNKDEQAVDNKNQDSKHNQQNQQNQDDGKQDKSNNENKNDKQNQNQDEQNANQQEQNSKEQNQQNPQQGNEDEQAQQAENQQQEASKAEEDSAQSQDNFRATVNAMSKAEARQLLESMKDSDKVLPLRGFGEQKQRFEKSSYKDW